MSSTTATDSLSSLPTENLQQIFSALIHSTTSQLSLLEFNSSIVTKHLEQLACDQRAISTTCSRWRAIAVGYPPLWTYIPLRSRPWVLECLSRSKTLPIALFGALIMEGKFGDVIFPELGRIKRIAFLDDAQWLDHWIQIHLLSSLPSTLEALYVGVRGTFVAPDPDTSQSVDMSMLFSLPNLRRLEVSRHLLNWETSYSFKATRLTSLSINHTQPALSPQLFSILQQTPALESLAIIERYYNYLDPVALPQSIVHLPHLAVLQVGTHLDRCVDMLSRLRHPLSTMLDITLGYHDPSSERTRVSELMMICGLQDAPAARQLDIRSETMSKGKTMLTVWDNIPESSLSGDDKARVTIRFSGAWLQPDLVNWILVHLSVPNVERLLWASEHSERVSYGELCKLAHGMPNVTELAIKRGLTIRPYAPVFSQLVDLADREQSRLMYFPSLLRLELSGVDFRTVENHQSEVDVLVGMLAHRKKHQAGIRSLYLKDCVCIRQEVVDELERAQVVQEVIWDGRSDREWVES